MNALYRPGPMEYIPSFNKRSTALKKSLHDLHDCEEAPKDLWYYSLSGAGDALVPKAAGFSKGEADTLRKPWVKRS